METNIAKFLSPKIKFDGTGWTTWQCKNKSHEVPLQHEDMLTKQ